MPVERRNPLPAGIYWVDLLNDEQVREFADWLARNPEVDELRRERTEAGDIDREWVLFEVPTGHTHPVVWEGPGLPTIAPRGGQTTEADTVQKPDAAPDLVERIKEAATMASPWVKAGVVLAALGLVLKIAEHVSKARRASG